MIDYGACIANIGVVTPAKLEGIPRRSYRSLQRERQARETRARILAAACAEFERRGYAATRMRAVAQAAGVSVPTLELVFGTKPQLLRAAISFAIRGDAEPIPMLKRPWAQRALEAASAGEFLATVGRVLVDGEQRSAGIIVAAFEAANQDESMSALADQLRGQRAETAGWLVDGVIARASLRGEITREQAIDTVWLLMDPNAYLALTRDRGWTAERFEAWFTDSVRRLLLPSETEPLVTTRSRLSSQTTSTPKRKAEDTMSEQANRPAAAGEKYSVDTGLARPGAFTYIHIPATDVRRAAVFYRDVFGWHINNPDSDRPSFDDGSGRFSGAWISDHLATAEPGLLPYIYVADVRETVTRIIAHGGAIVTEPYPEGLLTVSTFRDPAGNVVGLWHDTTRSPATSEPGAPSSESAVAPVPEHLHTITPRLAITDAAAAIDFYATAFDAREIGERYCAPDGTLIHAELRIGDSIVMITEDEGYRALLCTYWPDVDAAWERAVAAGAQVLHPLADHFYGERGGRVKDPFDQEWMLGARLEKLTGAEIAARAPAHD